MTMTQQGTPIETIQKTTQEKMRMNGNTFNHGIKERAQVDREKR